jgi:hypothetical protein
MHLKNKDTDIEYEELCPLPEWAYSEAEYIQCFHDADLVADRRFFKMKEKDEVDIFIDEVIKD